MCLIILNLPFDTFFESFVKKILASVDFKDVKEQ